MGCVHGDASDGCETAASVGDDNTIAVSPDGTSVYVGSSDGTVVGFARWFDGSLRPISCVTSASPAPAGCDRGHGLAHVSALAVSPDRTWLRSWGSPRSG